VSESEWQWTKWPWTRSWINFFTVQLKRNIYCGLDIRATNGLSNRMIMVFRMESSDCSVGKSADKAEALFQDGD